MEVSTLGSTNVCEASDNQFEDPASLANCNVTSTPLEIPSKPSDIVRYLYYDDSIKFEEDSSVCDESFNSVHSSELSPLLEPVVVSSDMPSENLVVDVKELPEDSKTLVKDVTCDKPVEKNETPQPQLENVGVTMSLSKSEAGVDESVHSFIGEGDQFESVYSESGSTEQWFDLEASKSSQLVSEEVQMSQDTDELTETRSTTKDGDLPCVAEISKEKGSKSNVPIPAVDSDEVTDISTHFTMTEDDSDKFSDIESDSSLNNFDEDVNLSTDRNKSENLNLEFSKPFYSEGSKHGSLEQGGSGLDENANKDEDYAEECATPVEFSDDGNQIQDIEASLRDVNGNLKDLLANAKASDTVEDILSATDAVCDISKEQSFSVQTAEFDALSSEMGASGSTFADINKDEFFDVSQTEDSLNISRTGEIDNWSDAKCADLTETDDLNFRSPADNVFEAVSSSKAIDSSTSDNDLKENTSCFAAQNEQMVVSCDKIEEMPVPAEQEVLFTINIESGSTVLSSESQEVVCTDKIILDDKSLLKEIVCSETLEDGSLTNLDATALSQVAKEVPEVDNINDIVVNASKFASAENMKMICTIEQKDESEEVCRAFYETKEKDPDSSPKVAESVPNPVSDVSGTECIPNFGIERITSLSLDENVGLTAQIDFSAQLKTASSLDDNKFQPSEIDFSKTAAPVTDIVDFKGIIADPELLNEQSNVESKTVSNSESIDQLEPECFKAKTKENEIFDFKIDVSEVSVNSPVQNTERTHQEIEAKEIGISGRVDKYQDETIGECIELSFAGSVKESEIYHPEIDVSKLSVLERTEEDTCTVDFKTIVLDSTEVNKEKDVNIFNSVKQQEVTQSIQESEISQSKTVFPVIPVSEVAELSTCSVDFRGIPLDSEEVNEQTSSSESKIGIVSESLEQHSVFELVKEVSQSKFDVPEAAVSAGAKPDTYVVDFKGIILDSEEVNKQQKCTVDYGIGIVPESPEQPSVFETILESEISQTKIGVSEVPISDVAGLDICVVDFKGIIADSEVENKQETSCPENQIMGISGSTEKQTIEPIVEPELKKDVIPRSELGVSRITISEEDGKGDNIVDFKGIVLDSESLISQQKFSTEDKIISSSKSPKHFEHDVIESVTATEIATFPEIDVSKESLVCLAKNVGYFSEEKSIEEKGLVSADHAQEMDTVNFKEIVLSSDFPVSSDIPGSAVIITTKDLSSTLETDETHLVSDYKLDTVQTYTNGLISASDETTENYGTVNKDEVIDTSYHSLSEESDIYVEDDSSSSFKDFSDYSIPKPQSGLHVKDVKASTGFETTINDSIQKDVSDLASKEASIKESSMKIKPSCILKAHEEALTSDTDSSYFHSTHEDKDSPSVVTSDDDFTDVPSHITLTEDSDTWSDVDTSIGIEDLDQDSFNMMKEKTPTRDGNEFECEFSNKDVETENQNVPHNILSKKTELKIQDEFVVNKDIASTSDAVDQNLHLKNELTKESKDEPTILSDDNTDVASFNSITDECETWSDNEITASLTDYMPPSFDKKEMISSEMNADKSTELNYVTIETELSHSISENVAESSLCTISGDKLISDQTFETSIATTLFDTTITSHEVLLEANKRPTDSLPKDSMNGLFPQDSLQTRKSSDSDDKNVESDIHRDSSDLSCSTASKEEYVEKFSDLETEHSEMSTSSFFETISKDDDSEKFSDSGSENFKEYKSSVSALEKHEEHGSFKIISKEVDFKKSDREDESSEMATIDILPEPVPLVVDKKALSLSIADIVESSEVDVKCDQTTEPLILEHYADVKSLSQQVALVENLNAFEIDAAVSKTHKETTDSSVGTEQVEESDYCLGTETDFSISEFEDEAVSLSEKEKTDPFPSENLHTSGISEDKLNNFKTTSEMSMENVTGISVSFSTDNDYSDQVSDTYADISLQGGTTENSDKWSDFEGEAVVDVLDEHIQMIDSEELRNQFDFSLGIEHESAVPCKNNDQVKKQSSLETDSDIMLARTLENSSKISKTFGSIEGNKQKESSSLLINKEIKTEGKTNEQISVSSEKLLDTASGMSDDEFTSITPMDVTVEESDKYSDISDDTSVEEMPDSSKSVSLKKGCASLSDTKAEDSVNDSFKKIDEKLNINIQSENQTVGLVGSSENASKEPPEKLYPQILSSVESTIVTSDIISEQLLLPDIQEEVADIESVDYYNTGEGQFKSSVEEDLLNQNITYDSSNMHSSPIYENDDEHFEDDEYPEEYDPNFDENELDEEDYNNVSVPYILNDDELVYPLQYGEDWIEESFDLKEYGIEAAFSGSETDVHGLNINDEYDEDIHRAIDMNLSNFEEAIESFMDDPNLATESFKTLSNNTPTQSKPTDKEHDSWSTADADSIEDDLSDHDDVLSKIDEILAEDFGYSKMDYFSDEEITRSNKVIGENIQGQTETVDVFNRETLETPPFSSDSERRAVTEKNDVFDSASPQEKITDDSKDFPKPKTTDRLMSSSEIPSKFSCDGAVEDAVDYAQVSVDKNQKDATEDTKRDRASLADSTLENLSITYSSTEKEQKSFTTGILNNVENTISKKRSEEITSLETTKMTPEAIEINELSKDVLKIISKSGNEKLPTVTSEPAEVELPPKENIVVPTEATKLKLSSTETSMSSERTVKLKSALDQSSVESKEPVKLKSALEESSVESGEAVKLKLPPKETTLTPVEEMKVKLLSDQTSIASDEIVMASEKTVKLKSSVNGSSAVSESVELKSSLEESSVAAEEAVKLKLPSKETTPPQIEEIKVKSPSEQTSISSDKTSISSERTVKLKSAFEVSSVASEEAVKLKLSSEGTTLTAVEEMKVKLPTEQTSITSDETSMASEKTVKLKSNVGQSSVESEEAVKLKLSSKETTLTPVEEIKVKLLLDQTSIASNEIAMNSEKTVKLKSSVNESSAVSESVKLKSSLEESSVDAEGAVKLKLPSKETTPTQIEEIKVKSPSELTSISSDKTSISPEKSVKLKSSLEESSEAIEEALKLQLPLTETTPTPSEEMKVKSQSEQTSIASDETSMTSDKTLKLKSSLEESSVNAEEAVKLKLSSKETTPTQIEEINLKSPSKQTFIASNETSMASEKAVNLKSSVKESSAVSESVELKSSLEESSVVSESVKLKSSLEESSVNAAEAAKLKLPSKATTLTQTEEYKVKSPSEQTSIASDETSIAPEKTVKLKSSHEESSVAVEEALKLSLKETPSSSTEVKEKLPSEKTTVISTEASEVKPDIPLKKKRSVGMSEHSEQFCKVFLSETDSDSSLSSSSESTSQQDFKPDIPDKTKRRCRPKPETTSNDQEQFAKAPALPRKRPKRESSTESISSSVFLSSSSESLSSYESAPLKESSKSDTSSLKTCPSASADVPEVPVRKAKVKSSSIRERRRDSAEDSSSASSISESSRRSYDLPQKEAMDLCRKRTSIDVRMIKLQNEGKCSTKEKAFIAAKLIEMQFEEEDALLASRQCNSVYHAIKFLTQLCELCNCRFPVNLMTSMFHCTHRACKECLKAHFTSLIYDRSIFTLLCPICHKPDITDQNIQEYFNHLEIMFRNLLAGHVYDLFQRKLRDEVLTKDPNFHWCSQCSSGFIASPRLKKLYCPDCSAITCAMCHQTWELEHEGVHCERFQQWKDMHTPEPPPAGLVKYLTDRGVTCSSCDLKFDQACGGSLHYKCCHCSFEFCGFCSQPYKRGKECGDNNCESRGLHAHHPYSCLFFIRDIEISDLQMLLEEESVTYLTIPPKDQIVKSRCQVREQKHIHGSRSEDRCGRDIVPYCAGLCRTHYYEYLAELLRKNKINPLSVMTIQDLQFILRKSRVMVPDRIKGETNEDYYKRLTKIVSSTLT